MFTINQLIDFVDRQLPNNFEHEDKHRWIDELTRDLWENLIKDYTRLSYEEYKSEYGDLLVNEDDMFVQWLMAKMYLYLGDNTKYNNAIGIFNQKMSEFRNYYLRHNRKIGSGKFKNWVT